MEDACKHLANKRRCNWSTYEQESERISVSLRRLSPISKRVLLKSSGCNQSVSTTGSLCGRSTAFTFCTGTLSTNVPSVVSGVSMKIVCLSAVCTTRFRSFARSAATRRLSRSDGSQSIKIATIHRVRTAARCPAATRSTSCGSKGTDRNPREINRRPPQGRAARLFYADVGAPWRIMPVPVITLMTSLGTNDEKACIATPASCLLSWLSHRSSIEVSGIY